MLRQQREAFVLAGGGDSGAPVYQKRGRRSARAVGIVSSGSSPYFSTTVLGEPTVVYLVMRYTHARRFERKSAAGICTPRRC